MSLDQNQNLYCREWRIVSEFIEEMTFLIRLERIYICVFLPPNFHKNCQKSRFPETLSGIRLFPVQMKDYCLCVSDLRGADWQQAQLK